MMGMGLRITFYKVWRTNRGGRKGGWKNRVEVLDVQRQGETERTSFGVRKTRHGFWGKTV